MRPRILGLTAGDDLLHELVGLIALMAWPGTTPPMKAGETTL
jgi:hypothetical protein